MNKFKIGDLVTAQSGAYVTPPRYIVGLTDSAVILSKNADDSPVTAESYIVGRWNIEHVKTKNEPVVEKVTPENIVVGKYYTRPDYPDCVWLACGKRKPYTVNEFTEKFLVLVSADPCIGYIYKTEDDDEGCWPGDWDNFKKVD